ncbi:hypothetical protein BBJ29_008439 [Phytophthora kernoviae]|uniref:GOLD domain-containing protein n=1 Tax=Phytophthora kernoviae TaxID=325452 RepID=A0A3F2RIJ0_9STRA|nr:hypothetical protein BBJ29_008439 [Phytophthora kernoviae]RLN57728.1 hypothetical protein BBP00_00007382 [Phytophthora kernoviae]
MAADVSARVHLVAEKLQQKAQDAQRKGNDNIARALSASVSDLRQAMALISEQRHLLARRRAEGVDEEDDADAHVQQLATQLGRVEAMLGKKSEDMKAKGNENAAGALQQSAATVEQGRKLLLEQQQQIFGLLGRWEKIQDVVSDKERRRGSVATSGGEGDEKELETPHGQVIARARQLKQLEALLKEVFPECNEMEELREELEKVRDQREGKSEQIKNECEQLHQELKAAKEKLEESRQETLEVNQMLEQESSTLEEAKKELARQKEREIQRQEEVSALLEQQTETCHAMEELDALVTEKDQLVNKYADEIEKLRDQLESATVAVSEITEEASTEQCQEDIEMNLNVDGAENDHVNDVPVLELEGVGLQPTDITVEEQVETALAENDADFKDSSELEGTHADLQRKLADYEEQSQAQQDTISTLEQEQSELQQQIEHLTNAKAQVIEDLHSGKEETARLMQQLSALEREQGKFQQQNELLTKDKQQVIDKLQSAHEEEALRLLQRITDSDNTVEELSAQLAEMQEALKVKSAGKSEVTSALERCEIELSSCRTELEDRAHECSKLQGDLQSTQDVKDAEHEKRAELLNGMRKENDELLKQVTESNQEREQAEAARKTSEAHLQEVQRTQEMRQADFDQYAAEKGRAIAELEEETQRLESERTQVDNQIQELMLKIQELEMEKKQLEEECQRVKEAEQAAFEARLSTAANAVQTAKQDLLKVLAAKEEALKKLRLQVLELQEELHTLQEEKAAHELEREQKELDELQTSRQKMQSEKELALRLQRREALVAGFEKQVSSIVKELQQRLENHSTAFREVCDFRDEHRASLFAKDSGADNVKGTTGHKGEIEYDECLVMRSGVVIKAGASFQLPVICEKRGWRVVWNFTVKEEATDVAFKLTAIPESNAMEIEIVASERMNEKSGVFQVQHDNTTLVFEWDNSFSWLNEKTLDYHVSIQEPLTPQAQKVRHSKRELQFKAKLLEDGLALIQGEAERRSDLSATLEQLHECESAKETHLAEFAARKEEVLAQKTRFQEDMEAQKTILSAMLQEQDELEDVEHNIARAWAAAAAERQDVEMTLQLAGSLEALTQELEQQVMIVAEELARPITTTAETVNNSKSEDSECKGPEGVNGVAEIREVEVDSSVHSSPEEKHGQPSVENHPEDASTELTTKDSSASDDQ